MVAWWVIPRVGEARRSWGLFEVSDKLVHLRDSDPVFRKAFTIATQLEGLYRQPEPTPVES